MFVSHIFISSTDITQRKPWESKQERPQSAATDAHREFMKLIREKAMAAVSAPIPKDSDAPHLLMGPLYRRSAKLVPAPGVVSSRVGVTTCYVKDVNLEERSINKYRNRMASYNVYSNSDARMESNATKTSGSAAPQSPSLQLVEKELPRSTYSGTSVRYFWCFFF